MPWEKYKTYYGQRNVMFICKKIFTKHVYDRGVYDCQFSLKSNSLSLLEVLKTCRDKKTF